MSLQSWMQSLLRIPQINGVAAWWSIWIMSLFTASFKVIFLMVNVFMFGDFGRNEKSSLLIPKSCLGEYLN